MVEGSLLNGQLLNKPILNKAEYQKKLKDYLNSSDNSLKIVFQNNTLSVGKIPYHFGCSGCGRRLFFAVSLAFG